MAYRQTNTKLKTSFKTDLRLYFKTTRNNNIVILKQQEYIQKFSFDIVLESLTCSR